MGNSLNKSKFFRCVSCALLPISFFACSKSTPDVASQPAPLPQSIKQAAIEASTESCKKFITRLQNDSAKSTGSFYDFITVPEDPNDPASKPVKIFYYGRTVPGQTPIVFFNGGPAGNSHSSYVLLTARQALDTAWSNIPFIFIDQRGTGCSDAYPQGRTDDVLQRLTHYGSRGIVNDAELIRQHLGFEKWKVFGQSFGAFVVHRYMVTAPQSVVAAYAHAGVITSDPIQRLTGRIHSQNRVIEAYLSDFPSDRAVLQTLDTKLTPTTCFSGSNPNDKVCGTEVLSPLLDALGFTDQWLWMHLNFNRLVKNDQLNESRIHDFLNANVFVPAVAGRSTGVASSVIGWADRNVASTTKTVCQQVYGNLKALGEKPETWLFNECYAPLQDPINYSHDLRDRIHRLPQDLLTLVDFKQALTNHPEIPFYLYAGAKDAYVPVDDYKEELDTLGSLVRYTFFSGTGHDGFVDEPQVWDDLTAQ